MNIQDIISGIQASELSKAQEQITKMETEDLTALGPMNMLAFDN